MTNDYCYVGLLLLASITSFMYFSDPYSTCITGLNCYKVMVEVGLVTKVTAEETCNKYGGHLVSMETQHEYTNVISWLIQSRKNLALRKMTKQSSTFNSGHAVDGNM